jgi:hypothetical protein
LDGGILKSIKADAASNISNFRRADRVISEGNFLDPIRLNNFSVSLHLNDLIMHGVFGAPKIGVVELNK